MTNAVINPHTKTLLTATKSRIATILSLRTMMNTVNRPESKPWLISANSTKPSTPPSKKSVRPLSFQNTALSCIYSRTDFARSGCWKRSANYSRNKAGWCKSRGSVPSATKINSCCSQIAAMHSASDASKNTWKSITRASNQKSYLPGACTSPAGKHWNGTICS